MNAFMNAFQIADFINATGIKPLVKATGLLLGIAFLLWPKGIMTQFMQYEKPMVQSMMQQASKAFTHLPRAGTMPEMKTR